MGLSECSERTRKKFRNTENSNDLTEKDSLKVQNDHKSQEQTKGGRGERSASLGPGTWVLQTLLCLQVLAGKRRS